MLKIQYWNVYFSRAS